MKKSRLKQAITSKQADIAARLRKVRLNRKLSLQDVSSLIGMSKVTLSCYETMDIVNIPFDKIEALAKIYHVTPAYLLGWDSFSSSLEMAEVQGYSESEQVLIEKYRFLSREGQKTIDAILDLQYKLACKIKSSSPNEEAD